MPPPRRKIECNIRDWPIDSTATWQSVVMTLARGRHECLRFGPQWRLVALLVSWQCSVSLTVMCSQLSMFFCLWSKTRNLHQQQKLYAINELPAFCNVQSFASATTSMFHHFVSYDSPPFLWHFMLRLQLLCPADCWRCSISLIVVCFFMKPICC